jgi:hypothetical protein
MGRAPMNSIGSPRLYLPPPPAEPPTIHATEHLAPRFRDALALVCLDLAHASFHPVLRETLRTDARQAWLYEFGRTWDDGRGIVTNARSAFTSWHGYGLAADVGDRRYEPGQEPSAFWCALERFAIARRLASGAEWQFCDRPHLQWGHPMRVSPTARAAELLAAGGVEAVWREVGAMDP